MLSFKNLLLFLLFIPFLSCQNKDADAIETTWIGGQIINPKVDYIIFSQDSNILDTVKLDSNNFFLFRSDKITAGLYSFRHYENQIMFLEPGDSLMLYLNTIDFDESLAYSGKGAERNNLLMDFFLSNENDINTLSKWYPLSPEKFTAKIDSVKKIKTKIYKDYQKINEVSKDFDDVIQANLNYHYYSQKELYATANSTKVNSFPKEFFEYRKNIDFGNHKLRFYYPYYRYLYRYVNNLAIQDVKELGKSHNSDFNYNYRKIELMDSLIPLETLRNSFLRHTAVQYILNARVAEEQNRFFTTFSKLTTSQKDIKEVEELVNASIKLTAGNLLPDILLTDSDGISKRMPEIIKSPSVIFFWSSKYTAQHRNSHIKVAELKLKYPEYNFIGINTDSHSKNWRETIIKEKYNPNSEFQLENLTDAQKTLVLNSLNKVILVDKNKKIIDGNCNLFHHNFENLLLENLNK